MSFLASTGLELLALAAQTPAAEVGEVAAITAKDSQNIAAAEGAGLAFALGTLGPGLAVGIIVGMAMQATARQPEAHSKIQTMMFLGVAMAEGLGIIGFVVAMLLKFV